MLYVIMSFMPAQAALAVFVSDVAPDPVMFGVFVIVGDCKVGVSVCVHVGVNDGVTVDVPDCVHVGVLVNVSAPDGRVNVGVTVGVHVGVFVTVIVGVSEVVHTHVVVFVGVIVEVAVPETAGVDVHVFVIVHVAVAVGDVVNNPIFTVGVGVNEGVAVYVYVGDTHDTLNNTAFENSDTLPVAPMPATFGKLEPHAFVVAHHVYEPLWSLIFPRLQLTKGLVVPAPGLEPAYVKPAGTVSYSVTLACVLGIRTMKLLYESCVVPS